MAKKTNLQLQKELDEQKWLDSEICGYDKSGFMYYCALCPSNSETGCKETQLNRVMNCLCAKAHNKNRGKK